MIMVTQCHHVLVLINFISCGEAFTLLQLLNHTKLVIKETFFATNVLYTCMEIFKLKKWFHPE